MLHITVKSSGSYNISYKETVKGNLLCGLFVFEATLHTF